MLNPMLRRATRRPAAALRRHLASSLSAADAAAPRTPPPRATRLADYTPFPYTLHAVALDFDLRDAGADADAPVSLCTSTLRFSAAADPHRQPAGLPPLELDGQELDTLAVHLDGAELLPDAGYTIAQKPDGDHVMSIVPPVPPSPSQPFELKIQTRLRPDLNTKLEGLYRSSGTFCTQCEAQGFRRITWFPDRPDVLAPSFTVKLTADRATCPVLLSNGNLVATEDDLPGGRHSATWVDPFAKPCYLFALVAGDLVALEDTYTTRPGGRDVALKIWTQAHNADKTAFAMRSLKESFAWDEDRFGLEYDLDVFQIVAVDDFNMGAMENKSLNVFNSRLVLATPETATDMDYERIQGVVGHEYFHNWSGNRVTCRDWFQLSLKEGLTVFRDQEFTADLNSRAVKRIADVRLLRAAQFPEDSGAMAHPVRPASYEKIDNFYTVTVYEKGAEVIRMYHTLLGEERFMKGVALYFARHDGAAVTVDDFFNAMQDANEGEITLGPAFRRWYSQAGTPEVRVEWHAGGGADELQMTVHQQTPPTPDAGGDREKQPVCIPLAVGLVSKRTGRDVDLSSLRVTARHHEDGKDEKGASSLVHDAVTLRAGPGGASTAVLRCDAAVTTFTFSGEALLAEADQGVVPSILRDFSAPVRLTVPRQGRDELAFLLAHDSDSFNRAEAASRLMALMVEDSLGGGGGSGLSGSGSLTSAWDPIEAGFAGAITGLSKILTDDALDPAFRALALEPPTTDEIVDGSADGIDPLRVHHARARVLHTVADALASELLTVYAETRSRLDGAEYEWTPRAAGDRALSSRCLRYLMGQTDPGARAHALSLAEKQFRAANNMSDSFAALVAMNNSGAEGGGVRERCMRAFLQRWQDDNNVVVKYFMLESTTDVADNCARLRTIVDMSVAAGAGAKGAGAEEGLAQVAAAFDLAVPNHVYALCRALPASFVNFHAADGSGYRLLADWIVQVDAMNAQVGSRLAGPFTKWRKYDAGRQAQIRAELERVLAAPGLSANTREIVAKSLAQGAPQSKL